MSGSLDTPRPPDPRALVGAWPRFLFPSSIGVALLLVPFSYNGKVSILLGHLVDLAQTAIGSALPAVVTGIIVLSAVTALIARSIPTSPGSFFAGPLASILRPSWLGVGLRVVGAAISVGVLFEVGPQWLVGAATGRVILNDLLPIVFVVFFAAAFILPCLIEFGLMELVGGMASPVFRPLFGLPGRSAVDAFASWLGAASVGVLITADQYVRGFYTEREAAVIATNFSVVSIAFAYVIVDFVGLAAHFVPFYLTIVGCGAVAVLVCPFLPPLRGKPDRYVDGTERGLAPRETGADQVHAHKVGFGQISAAQIDAFHVRIVQLA